MNDLRDWASLLAAVGTLSLAVVAMFGRRQSVLARPLAALCVTLFGWNFATLAHHVVGGDAFEVFDGVLTALSPPFVLEVVLAFTGKARHFARVRTLAWGVFGALAFASLGGLVSPAVYAWIDEPSWSAWFLTGWVPTLTFEVVVLVRHIARSGDAGEKARARTVLLALAIGGTFAMCDVARGLGMPLPYLGAIGTLIAAGLLSTLAVRFELLDRNVSARSAIYVLGMIVAFVVAYLVVFSAFANRLGFLVFATALVTLLAMAVVRELAVGLAEGRARAQRLAVLGRFSAQMTHDIKGPLTALLGAVDVLGGADDEATRTEFLGLVTDQAKRILAIVERYDRVGRVEPRKTSVRIADVVHAVARAHRLTDVDADAGECDADRELLESALENVVRNAVEATGDPAKVRIEARREPETIRLVVVDRGEGMDARVLARALDDFFTTKATGSGLGLAFARRVMIAHGGDVVVESSRGVGTTVALVLPISASRAP